MADVSEWSAVEAENTHIDDLTLSGERGQYINKLMCAIKKKTDSIDDIINEIDPGFGENLVHKTQDEVIRGLKSFTSSKNTQIRIVDESIPSGRGFPEGSTSYPRIDFYGAGSTENPSQATDRLGCMQYISRSNGNGVNFSIACNDPSSSSAEVSVDISVGWRKSDDVYEPYSTAKTPAATSNSTDIATTEWTRAYYAAASVSSDERLKQDIAPIPDAVLSAWGDVNWVQFRYTEAIEKKGHDNARLHFGSIVQRVLSAFENRGLDARAFGLVCLEHLDESFEYDIEGAVVKHTPAQDVWGLRYNEALVLEAEFQRRRASHAEARLDDVESRLAALEAIVNGVN